MGRRKRPIICEAKDVKRLTKSTVEDIFLKLTGTEDIRPLVEALLK